MDRYDLYELAATAPGRYVDFLTAVHGGKPTALGEDFCGSGALARAWPMVSERHTAVATDIDAAALEALRARCAPRALARLTLRCADVRAVSDRVDILAALNFPIGYWHTRGDLLGYLRHARGRLNPGGCLVVDTYGGATAFQTGEYDQRLTGAGGDGGVIYTWEQRAADPISGRVFNAMHFTLPGGEQRRDEFVYDWRLWSAPELRDAMGEAGFRAVDVYAALGEAIDGAGRRLVAPVRSPEDLDDDYVLYIAGRV